MCRRRPDWLFYVNFAIGCEFKNHLALSRPTFGNRVRTISIWKWLEVEPAVCQAASQGTDILEVRCTSGRFLPQTCTSLAGEWMSLSSSSVTWNHSNGTASHVGVKSDLCCLSDLRQGRMYKSYMSMVARGLTERSHLSNKERCTTTTL